MGVLIVLLLKDFRAVSAYQGSIDMKLFKLSTY